MISVSNILGLMDLFWFVLFPAMGNPFAVWVSLWSF